MTVTPEAAGSSPVHPANPRDGKYLHCSDSCSTYGELAVGQ